MKLCNKRYWAEGFVFLLLLALCGSASPGSEAKAMGLPKESAADSAQKVIRLDPVTISGGRVIRLLSQVGKTEQVGSEIIAQNASRSLADVLAENSLLYIKSLGQGAQATSSFRGTSSSHTQVLWNGINLNSATLGNFDFSLIPGFFVDELNVYSGVAQMRNGSSIGGSVELNNKWAQLPDRSSRIMFRGEWGSWGTQTYGLSWQWRRGALTSNTRLYFQDSENNFRYENRVLSMNAFEANREQASYSRAGLMQEFYYALNKTDVLSLCYWGQWDQRELPQPITSFTTYEETQKTLNSRVILKYATERRWWKSILSAAYLRDALDYSKKVYNNMGNAHSENVSHSLVMAWDNAFEIHPEWELKASAQVRSDEVSSASYAGGKVSRMDAQWQGIVAWKPAGGFRMDLSATQELMKSSGKDASLVPNLSAALSYAFGKSGLSLRYAQSLNHRFPTLNDWYWNPGGNPNLKPEKAWSHDLGLSVEPFWTKPMPGCSSLHWKTRLSVYYMDVDDWIMWVPTGSGYIWEPRNFARVQAKGFEWMSQIRFVTATQNHQLHFNYAYSVSENRTDPHAATYGRQLPYIPVNKWNLRYAIDGQLAYAFGKFLGIKRWNAAYSVCFTDARYTSADESYYTPAYTLQDVLLGLDWKVGSGKFPLECKMQLKVNNIWNAYYESTQYYPMPRRNFSFGLTFIYP